MSSISLYHAAQEVQQAIHTCVDEDGVIDTDKFDLIQATFQQKAVATVAVFKTIGQRLSVLKSYVDEVKSQIDREERNQDRIKDYLMGAMLITGVEKIKSEDGLLTATLYKDRDVSVEIEDDAVFPASLCNDPKPPTPSKTKIKSAIESGEAISGARIVRKDRLTIK